MVESLEPGVGTLRDDRVVQAIKAATVPFPNRGVLRVHTDPEHVYRPKQSPDGSTMKPGPNRFDDPCHHYPVRYLGEQLSTCLLEVLAYLRTNPDADATLDAMHRGFDHPALVGFNDPELVDAVEDFLDVNKVGVFGPHDDAALDKLVDVFNRKLLTALGPYRRLGDLLKKPMVVAAFGDSKGAVRLDGSLIRNANTDVGRPITQEISRLLIEILGLQGLRYYSRHDEGSTSICWAIDGDVRLETISIKPLNPKNAEHRAAVQEVAEDYQLPLPPQWMS